MDAKPGFTSEALNMLTLKVKFANKPVICSLMLDEMAIRQKLDFDGQNYYGRLDFGTGLEYDILELAKECLVFMVVSMNENWKIPVGYFQASSLTGAQKAELTKHALNLLKGTGISIASLTFDGCSSNLTIARLLGCDLLANNLNSIFDNIAVFMDPAHMVKLVRNAFGEKRDFIDGNGKQICFNLVEKLFLIQEDEGCHLANNLRKSHIFFSSR